VRLANFPLGPREPESGIAGDLFRTKLRAHERCEVVPASETRVEIANLALTPSKTLVEALPLLEALAHEFRDAATFLVREWRQWAFAQHLLKLGGRNQGHHASEEGFKTVGGNECARNLAQLAAGDVVGVLFAALLHDHGINDDRLA